MAPIDTRVVVCHGCGGADVKLVGILIGGLIVSFVAVLAILYALKKYIRSLKAKKTGEETILGKVEYLEHVVQVEQVDRLAQAGQWRVEVVEVDEDAE